MLSIWLIRTAHHYCVTCHQPLITNCTFLKNTFRGMLMKQEDGRRSSRRVWYVLLGGALPAASHPSHIPLKVCALVVQIKPWHVLWLSPLLQLVSWGAGLGVLSPSGLLSLRLDEVAAQAVVCGRALWHFPHLLLWSPNWLTTGAEDKQSPKEPIPLASLEWFR